jgi:hypothetical protein
MAKSLAKNLTSSHVWHVNASASAPRMAKSLAINLTSSHVLDAYARFDGGFDKPYFIAYMVWYGMVRLCEI